jgi:hypothetical protein
MKKYKDYESWVNAMYHKAESEEEKGRIIINHINNAVIIIRGKDFKKGIARKHPLDKYSYKVGIAIAYARLNNIPIPPAEEIIKLKDLPYNTPNAYIKMDDETTCLIHKAFFEEETNSYICVIEYYYNNRYKIVKLNPNTKIIVKEE